MLFKQPRLHRVCKILSLEKKKDITNYLRKEEKNQDNYVLNLLVEYFGLIFFCVPPFSNIPDTGFPGYTRRALVVNQIDLVIE